MIFAVVGGHVEDPAAGVEERPDPGVGPVGDALLASTAEKVAGDHGTVAETGAHETALAERRWPADPLRPLAEVGEAVDREKYLRRECVVHPDQGRRPAAHALAGAARVEDSDRA